MFGETVPLLLALVLLAQPVPQPFPGAPAPGRSAAQAPPARPATAPATQPAPGAPARTPATLTRAGGEQAPSEVALGVGVYPNATFLGSYNAGQGQRYYLYGATASFAELVTYYRGLLKQRGELVFDEPATHMFDIGRFREETMAFPPSVTVKDYTWGGRGGYLNLRGGEPARFPTVIQIVPPPSGATP
jgi:hypothetical protein